jgi:hypothetical protein
MGLLKKEKDSDFPEPPSLPEFPGNTKEKGLPSIPPSLSEDFNRNMIKSAVSDNESQDNAEETQGSIPILPKENTLESGISNYEKFLPRESSFEESIRQEAGRLDGPDSIFVRIDKFKAAKKELADIKKNLQEVDAIIAKINEIKSREDVEVKDVNLSLDNIKKKISEMDSLVFNKV